MKPTFKNQSIFLACTLLLFGCAGYHIQQAEKHTQKALKRGVTIPKDTIRINSTDTITEIVTKNDTTYVTKTVTKTVTLEPIVEYKTRWQTKYETKYKYKTIKVENKGVVDSLNQVLKIERQKTKQTKAENRRSNWWIFLLIGFGLAYLPKLIRLLK